MTEQRESFPVKSQERYEWYRINAFLLELGRAASELGLKAEDAVQIGGTANFYRAYQAFGSMAVPNFRGTHDMDVISFNQGSVQRILNRLNNDKNSYVVDYTVGRSSSLPDKKSIYVKFGERRDPALSTGFEMDVYESRTGVIKFNHRLMTKDRIILDPPESLELNTLNPGKSRGLVGVPSLRDAFIIKMDIVDYSRSGLRSKDRIDVLTTLAVCNALGHDFEGLIEAVKATSNVNSTNAKLDALEEVFSTYRNGENSGLKRSPILPDRDQVDMAIKGVKNLKAHILT